MIVILSVRLITDTNGFIHVVVSIYLVLAELAIVLFMQFKRSSDYAYLYIIIDDEVSYSEKTIVSTDIDMDI